MEELKIQEMTPILKDEVCLWDRFSTENSVGYQNITRFICLRGLNTFFQDHEKIKKINPIKNEDHNYVLKGEKGKILGFICYRLDRIDGQTRMHIQAIAIHPYEQQKGYGRELLKIILSEPGKYMSKKPDIITADIDPRNRGSKKLFESLTNNYSYENSGFFDEIKINYKDIEEALKGK